MRAGLQASGSSALPAAQCRTAAAEHGRSQHVGFRPPCGPSTSLCPPGGRVRVTSQKLTPAPPIRCCDHTRCRPPCVAVTRATSLQCRAPDGVLIPTPLSGILSGHSRPDGGFSSGTSGCRPPSPPGVVPGRGPAVFLLAPLFSSTGCFRVLKCILIQQLGEDSGWFSSCPCVWGSRGFLGLWFVVFIKLENVDISWPPGCRTLLLPCSASGETNAVTCSCPTAP